MAGRVKDGENAREKVCGGVTGAGLLWKRHAWRPAEHPMADQKTNARTGEWCVTQSKQIVQWQRVAPLVFLQRPSDRVALVGKALLPGVFIGERRQNLGRNRVLLIGRQGDDFFQRLLQ